MNTNRDYVEEYPRCKDCKWIHEADSVKGTSFMGVELCPRHAAAPAMLNALELITSWYDDDTADTDKFDDLIDLAKQAIQQARS